MAGLKFFDRIKLILLDPKKYFDLIEKETGIKHAFVYFIILFLVSSLLSLGIGMVFVGPFMSFWQNMFGLANIPGLSPQMLVP
ncbi:hypothetical protein KY339_02575, partial [Candidatus Woesearchaeota archaeon]|nr:hypothetical protein [Candidatus Woesearchaeota archaeon]